MNYTLIKEILTPFTVPYLTTGTIIGTFVWGVMGARGFTPSISDTCIIFTGPYSIVLIVGHAGGNIMHHFLRGNKEHTY